MAGDTAKRGSCRAALLILVLLVSCTRISGDPSAAAVDLLQRLS
jgi:hypothetical protein